MTELKGQPADAAPQNKNYESRSPDGDGHDSIEPASARSERVLPLPNDAVGYDNRRAGSEPADSLPTVTRQGADLDQVLAQLRHAYYNLIGPDGPWDREQRLSFADGLIGPQIVKLERLRSLAVPQKEKWSVPIGEGTDGRSQSIVVRSSQATVVHSSEIADDPAHFSGEWVSREEWQALSDAFDAARQLLASERAAWLEERKLRASLAVSATEPPKEWKQLGDMLGSGGMYDPDFLIGMVRASLAVPQAQNCEFCQEQIGTVPVCDDCFTEACREYVNAKLPASLAVPATDVTDFEQPVTAAIARLSKAGYGEDAALLDSLLSHYLAALEKRGLRAGAGDRQPQKDFEICTVNGCGAVQPCFTHKGQGAQT